MILNPRNITLVNRPAIREPLRNVPFLQVGLHLLEFSIGQGLWVIVLRIDEIGFTGLNK